MAWLRTHRIVRSRLPPVDLFEDVADPADWPLLVAAEAKTNPRVAGSDGVVYPRVRYPRGSCLAAFWPDVVPIAQQARHLAYHWNGIAVDRMKDLTNRQVFAVDR